MSDMMQAAQHTAEMMQGVHQQLTSSYLPITVVAAIVIFFVKEIVEYAKKRSERMRKLSVYKILIAEEFRKNSWTIFILGNVIKHISRESWDMEVLGSKSESCKLQWKIEGESGYSMVYQFHTAVFEKHMVDIAVIDKVFFEKLKDCYQAIAKAKVSRLTMLDLCGSNDLFTLTHYIPGVIVAVELAEAQIKAAYQFCTGEELDGHKHTSYI